MIGSRLESYDPFYDLDLEDARAEARAERYYHGRLMRHPDCRDPDHPGCECCAERNEEPEKPAESDEEQ